LVTEYIPYLGCWQYLFAASIGTLVLQWEVHNNLPLCLTQLFMSLAVIVVLMVFKEPLLKNLVYRGHDPNNNNNSLLRNTNGDINGECG